MNRLIKTGATFIMAFFLFANAQAQATKTLSIDSIVQLDSAIIGDVTDFLVQVRVQNLSFFPDSIFGDIFYYCLTDSMDSAGAPPRIFELGDDTLMIMDGYIDTVHIDFQANELRTTPVNLIVVWPAMISPEVMDTDSIVLNVGFFGWIGIPDVPNNPQVNVIFPCPALQYIYIRPEEINLIKEIQILSMEGKTINRYNPLEFKSGFINVDNLSAGNYLVELRYFDKAPIRTKILKR